jgi:hypothetical protein
MLMPFNKIRRRSASQNSMIVFVPIGDYRGTAIAIIQSETLEGNGLHV